MSIRPADPVGSSRRWVGKAKLFNEDINVIKEPVLGTAPASPVVLSPALAVGTTPSGTAGEKEIPHVGTEWPGACAVPTSSVLEDPAPHWRGDNWQYLNEAERKH